MIKGVILLNKTSVGLVEYAKAQLGKPYWFGTFGQISTKTLYEQKKAQYPKYYTAKDFEKQCGQKVHDCIGLIKGYLWSDYPTSTPKYNSAQDVSADNMLGKCKERGHISTMPELPGVLVFMEQHVGVYIGDGYVIEARGHAYGVVRTKLSARPWTSWGKCPWIEYPEANAIKGDNLILEFQQAAIKDGFKFSQYGADGLYGSETKAVMQKCVVKKRLVYQYKNCTKLVQKLLGIAQDGLCGKNTDMAIRKFQTDNKLQVDGAVGVLTWCKLLGIN